VTPPCDGERHYYDLSLYVGLPVGMSMAVACNCGSASLMVTHEADEDGPPPEPGTKRPAVWTVSLHDGTTVLGPLARDSLVTVVDAELVVGVRRLVAEG
jgi:hypothetical protein